MNAWTRRSLLALPAAGLLLALQFGPMTAAEAEPVRASGPAVEVAGTPSHQLQTAIFAGGCFWGLEGVYEHITGVRSVTSGYAGGTTRSPSYEEVSTGTTGHAEAVQVVFDPAVVTYPQLLQVFFSVAHDPTELNRQGPDSGTQYRSAIFYRDAAQQRVAQNYITQLGEAGTFSRPIVTQVAPLGRFYPAEDYHQDYMLHHPRAAYIVRNDAPKVEQLRRQFPALYREWRG